MLGTVSSWLDRLRSTISITETPEGLRVDISRAIEAPPERVWELLVDTRQWPEWGPSVLDVATQPPRIQEGSTGRVRTIFGLWVPFTVTRMSKWSRAWHIGPVPATDHRVLPEKSSCRVGFEVPLYAFPYLLVCWVARRRIEELAKSATVQSPERRAP
ncbi:MAG: SRPBCC family protein [archaeon]